jgi:hypothetical protein
MKKIILPLLFIIYYLLFTSCSADISGKIQQNNAGSFTISAELKPAISGLIRSFQALSAYNGQKSDANIIDAQQISQSIKTSVKISSVSLKNTSDRGIMGDLLIENIPDLIPQNDFLKFEKNSSGGVNFNILVNLENGNAIINSLSPDLTLYLEALMSPVATGEVMTKKEYLDLLGSIYNKNIADEIVQSVIKVSLDFPGKITHITNGISNGKRAEFIIPLIDFLVLEQELNYQVVY